MRIHPRGVIVFLAFAAALVLAPKTQYAVLAVLAGVFIEACFIFGFTGVGVERIKR